MGHNKGKMSKEDEVKVAAEDSDDESTDDDMPEMEDTEEDAAGGKGKQSRSEKKSRKAMQKLGMKPVPGIIESLSRRAKISCSSSRSQMCSRLPPTIPNPLPHTLCSVRPRLRISQPRPHQLRSNNSRPQERDSMLGWTMHQRSRL